jgi:hypothetical protein
VPSLRSPREAERQHVPVLRQPGPAHERPGTSGRGAAFTRLPSSRQVRRAAKHRVMSPVEFLARLCAITPPERALQDDIGYDDVVVPGEDHAADSPESR